MKPRPLLVGVEKVNIDHRSVQYMECPMFDRAKARTIRYIYDHRAWPQRLVTKVFPEPILPTLTDFKIYVRLDDWAVGARIASE